MRSADPAAMAGTPRHRLIDRLQRQWDDIVDSPRAVARATAWFPEPIATLDDVLRIVGLHGTRDDHRADEALARLVGHAHSDELAARVVLERILPGLISIAVRRGRMTPGGTTACFDELVPAAWLLIRSYRLDRRPARIAVNLLRDSEYEVFVRNRRRRTNAAEQLVSIVPDHEVPAGHGDTLVDDVVRLGREIGIPRHDLRLLVELASGRRPTEIGAALGVTARTIRNRRAALAVLVRSALAGDEVTWPPPCDFYRRWELAARWADARAALLSA